MRQSRTARSGYPAPTHSLALGAGLATTPGSRPTRPTTADLTHPPARQGQTRSTPVETSRPARLPRHALADPPARTVSSTRQQRPIGGSGLSAVWCGISVPSACSARVRAASAGIADTSVCLELGWVASGTEGVRRRPARSTWAVQLVLDGDITGSQDSGGIGARIGRKSCQPPRPSGRPSRPERRWSLVAKGGLQPSERGLADVPRCAEVDDRAQ